MHTVSGRTPLPRLGQISWSIRLAVVFCSKNLLARTTFNEITVPPGTCARSSLPRPWNCNFWPSRRNFQRHVDEDTKPSPARAGVGKGRAWVRRCRIDLNQDSPIIAGHNLHQQDRIWKSRWKCSEIVMLACSADVCFMLSISISYKPCPALDFLTPQNR